MKDRFWIWLRKRLGITELATSEQIGATCREIGELAEDVTALKLAVANLGGELDVDVEMDQFRVPSGDPMGL